nr:helix-turn-helix domain-containing protein [Candidatus Nanohalobium constans]
MSDDKIPAWCAGEEWCPMTAASNIIGKKWHPVILSMLIEEEKGFNDLKEQVKGISSKVLSENLEDLQEKGLIERKVVSEKPFRVKYSVTQTGRELGPVLDQLHDWAAKHLEPAEKQESVI